VSLLLPLNSFTTLLTDLTQNPSHCSGRHVAAGVRRGAVRGVRRDAGGGAGAHRVRLPRLRDPAGAPAGAHAAAPAPGAAHPRPRIRRRRARARARTRARARAGSRAYAVRRLRRAAERSRGPLALRVPSLRRRAHCRRRTSPGRLRLPAPRQCLRPGAAPSRHYFDAIPTPGSRGAYLVI
jgi:hypothetical protein